MNDEHRGRDPLISTGRGGAGNIVRELSRGPDDALAGVERGREIRDRSVDRATHSGRGGAGNIRSPSRDPKSQAICEAQEDALQDALIAERRGRAENQTFTTGRGGAGNIENRSRSRSAVRDVRDVASPSPASPLARVGSSSRTRAGRDESRTRGFHAGRGGYGNITEEATEEELARRRQEELYEAQVKKKYEEGEPAPLKTTGRGGAGSVAQDLAPVDLDKLTLEEREARDKFYKDEIKQPIRGGRGGAGNIVPREERGRESSGHQHTASTGSVFGSMLRSLSRAARGEKEPAK
ncbi:hypothetical protein CC85DRAFT_296853 [Cutaneotrichosporon oleaginosum]|uniref:Uncharacterized protein n=1 Tax=Cutaneotrichosporon oleaginosum TaxID=879819 RepID=A0A0J0XKV1_9TREE|nr:uncharacterized protein CC85DRAFT_296853 [Cutaneotrichosporon oleaginosum]KLT41731.1 hypothetical protein CC85DRAFT_296853 [Cutaneotrichosporon oleaginosum]TXT12329.1 hypothetical protein COLE_02739 [Cutaneotrichosporon oleaginosum]